MDDGMPSHGSENMIEKLEKQVHTTNTNTTGQGKRLTILAPEPMGLELTTTCICEQL